MPDLSCSARSLRPARPARRVVLSKATAALAATGSEGCNYVVWRRILWQKAFAGSNRCPDCRQTHPQHQGFVLEDGSTVSGRLQMKDRSGIELIIAEEKETKEEAGRLNGSGLPFIYILIANVGYMIFSLYRKGFKHYSGYISQLFLLCLMITMVARDVGGGIALGVSLSGIAILVLAPIYLQRQIDALMAENRISEIEPYARWKANLAWSRQCAHARDCPHGNGIRWRRFKIALRNQVVT